MKYVEFKFFERFFKYKTNEEMKEIVNKSQKNKNDLLFYFSIKENTEIVRFLIENRAGVNKKYSFDTEISDYLISVGAKE